MPREESGRSVGPAYASRLIEFASSFWRPTKTAHQSDSLRRMITCIEKLARAV